MNIKKVDDKPDRVGCLVLFQREGDKHGYWWQIDSVKSTRWSNMDCKSDKKSCLNRVNLEASGTTSNPQKSRSSWEYFRNTISREVVGIEKISCNNRAFIIG